LVTQATQRILTQPDILFTAEDLFDFQNGAPFLLVRSFAAAPNFINNDAINGVPALDGPGVISPVSAPRPINISFNKLGPFIFNQGPFPDGTGFLDELNNTGQGFVWGSFDGTTNDPVVYPIGTSIQ